MLGASTLASWGTLGRSWDDPGTLEGTRKDPVSSRLGFYRFFVDLGDRFLKVFGDFWTNKNDFFICISRLLFLMILGLNSGVRKTIIWHGRYCKNQLSQRLVFL